ncbi:MAG: hypothetical protein JWN08_420 [Frankiales bacterium]|nr:hypothetical protein [Frankiales bacterium]
MGPRSVDRTVAAVFGAVDALVGLAGSGALLVTTALLAGRHVRTTHGTGA